MVAAMYLNRLHKHMPLQADPTVKFALGNFGLRRIMNEHLKVDSPYNTYKPARFASRTHLYPLHVEHQCRT